jgi:plasmid replication initiation protein
MEKNKQIVPLSNSDNIFVQSNEFIQAKYKDSISFWEMMIFGRMCTLIDPNDTDFKEYRIYVKDLINLVDVEKSGQLYDRILEAATKLRKREILVQSRNEMGEERVLETYLVTGVERAVKANRSENAYVALSFHPRLKPFLLELKRDFTKFDIRNYRFLHSGTVARLYQLLKSNYDRRRRDPTRTERNARRGGQIQSVCQFPHQSIRGNPTKIVGRDGHSFHL